MQAAIEDLAERLHRRVRLLRQVVRQVELELVADDAALAQQLVEAGHGDVDDFGALRLEAVERLAHDAGDFVVFRRRAPQRPQHADARALETVGAERVAIATSECATALSRRDLVGRIGARPSRRA